jgi:hypothetical protein
MQIIPRIDNFVVKVLLPTPRPQINLLLYPLNMQHAIGIPLMAWESFADKKPLPF